MNTQNHHRVRLRVLKIASITQRKIHHNVARIKVKMKEEKLMLKYYSKNWMISKRRKITQFQKCGQVQ